jgi:hypothetical protein
VYRPVARSSGRGKRAGRPRSRSNRSGQCCEGSYYAHARSVRRCDERWHRGARFCDHLAHRRVLVVRDAARRVGHEPRRALLPTVIEAHLDAGQRSDTKRGVGVNGHWHRAARGSSSLLLRRRDLRGRRVALRLDGKDPPAKEPDSSDKATIAMLPSRLSPLGIGDPAKTHDHIVFGITTETYLKVRLRVFFADATLVTRTVEVLRDALEKLDTDASIIC